MKKFLLFSAVASIALCAQPAYADTDVVARGMAANALNRIAVTARGEINAASYLSTAQQVDVTARTGTLDLTAAIGMAVTAANATTGTKLHFPAGRWITNTCNYTLSVNVVLEGDGQAPVDSSNAGGTTLECTHNTNSMITLTGKIGRVRDITIKDSAASRTAGSAILINSAYEGYKLDMDHTTLDGFWDALDGAVTSTSSVTSNNFLNYKHLGQRVRNTLNSDAGDWDITLNKFYSASGALADIQWESSGGGTIGMNDMVPNAGTHTSCLIMNTTGHSSVQARIIFNKCEGVNGIPYDIQYGYSPFIFTGNIAKTNSLTAEGLHLGFVQFGSVCQNTFEGSGMTAITRNTVNNIKFCADNSNNGYTQMIDPAGLGSNSYLTVVNIGGQSIEVGNSTSTTSIDGMTRLASGRFSSSNTGAPAYLLNSLGSYYGQINPVSSDVWGLGYGATETAVGTTVFSWSPTSIIATVPIKRAGYTVATLPASPGTGAMAYVTDAVACTFLGALTGGAATFCPVIYNGIAWVGE